MAKNQRIKLVKSTLEFKNTMKIKSFPQKVSLESNIVPSSRNTPAEKESDVINLQIKEQNFLNNQPQTDLPKPCINYDEFKSDQKPK